MNRISSPIKAWLIANVALATICFTAIVSGCHSTPSTIAYKGEVATDAAVRSAMVGWGAYVAAKHPGTNSEAKVRDAFNLYKQAQLTLIDATAAFASNPTNSTPVQAATSVVVAAQANLVNLISSITNTIH